MIFEKNWKVLDREQAGVIEARNMDRIARQHWYGAIREVRMERQLTGADFKAWFNRTNKTRRAKGLCGAAISRHRLIDWKSYDYAYHFWKEHKKNRIARQEALRTVDEVYGAPLFFVLYPLYKISKPFRKLLRALRSLWTESSAGKSSGTPEL